MALEFLFDRQRLLKVVLVYTPSNSMSLFIQDSLKSRYNISKDSILAVNTKKELGATKEYYNVVPFLSDRWLFHIKQADKLIKKDFIKLVRDNTSGIYLLEFENYRNYKFTKDLLSNEQGVMDLYLAWLNNKDFDTLHNKIVLQNDGFKLPKTLLDFVRRGYSSEIDSLFTLFGVLKEGTAIKSRKQIIDLCGLSSNTIDNFMFSLLSKPTESDKGLKRYISNRLKEAIDLAEKYTWVTYRNYLKTAVKACIDIKVIISSGEVYDNIRNYQSEAYDVKKLAKYQRHLKRIKQIPLSRFLGLLDNLEKRTWRSDTDFLTFFFNYILYKYKSNVELREMIVNALKGEDSSTPNSDSSKRTKRSAGRSKPVTSDEIKSLEEQRLKTRNLFSDKLKQTGGN